MFLLFPVHCYHLWTVLYPVGPFIPFTQSAPACPLFYLQGMNEEGVKSWVKAAHFNGLHDKCNTDSREHLAIAEELSPSWRPRYKRPLSSSSAHFHEQFATEYLTHGFSECSRFVWFFMFLIGIYVWLGSQKKKGGKK